MANNEKMTNPKSMGMGGETGLNKDLSKNALLEHENIRSLTKPVLEYDINDAKTIPSRVLADKILKPFFRSPSTPLKNLESAARNIKTINKADAFNAIRNTMASATLKLGDIEATLFANMSNNEVRRRRGYIKDTFRVTPEYYDSRSDDRPGSRVGNMEATRQQIGFMLNIPIKFRK